MNAWFFRTKKANLAVAFVPTTGFEPARPFEHHPLKMASLPISPRGQKSDCYLSDPTGARTQDPNIKSVVLYQLSYRVKSILAMRVQI